MLPSKVRIKSRSDLVLHSHRGYAMFEGSGGFEIRKRVGGKFERL